MKPAARRDGLASAQAACVLVHSRRGAGRRAWLGRERALFSVHRVTSEYSADADASSSTVAKCHIANAQAGSFEMAVGCGTRAGTRPRASVR